MTESLRLWDLGEQLYLVVVNLIFANQHFLKPFGVGIYKVRSPTILGFKNHYS